jgi:hypothetical protein
MRHPDGFYYYRLENGTTVATKNEYPKHSGKGVPLDDVEFTNHWASEAYRLLRLERNELLTASDWRMASDYPRSNQAEWQTYRQALRDITTQTPSLDGNGQLTGITWPTPPTD